MLLIRTHLRLSVPFLRCPLLDIKSRLIHWLMRCRMLCMLIAIGLYTQYGYSHTQYNLKDASLMARVNGVAFPHHSVDILLDVVKRKDNKINQSALLRGLIENRVLAEYVQQRYTPQDLEEESQSRVGFSSAVELQNNLVNALRQHFHIELERSLSTLPTGHLDGTVKLSEDFTQSMSAQLKQLTTLTHPLRYQFKPEQRQKAADYILATYQFPKPRGKKSRASATPDEIEWAPSQAISLLDIYDRVNVQGRIAIHKQDLGFIEQQIRRWVMQAYVLYWAETQSGLSKLEISALQQFFSDRRAKNQFLQKSGLLMDIHDHNSALKTLAQSVTQDEIKQYYHQHKEDFKVIEKVQAQHIRLPSQSLADTVSTALENGLDFNDAVRRYSISEDKTQLLPGDLGWITKEDRSRSWLKGITFVQPEGRISKPFRSPQVHQQPVYWEIVKVRKKVHGYQAVDSEGVRYQASLEIAKQKAVEQFEARKQTLLKQATIELNAQYVSADVYEKSSTKSEFRQKHHAHVH